MAPADPPTAALTWITWLALRPTTRTPPHTHTKKQKRRVTDTRWKSGERTEAAGLWPQPRDAADPGGWRRQGRTPRAPLGGVARLTPVSPQWTSGPRNESSFCCLEPPGLCGQSPGTLIRQVNPPSAHRPLPGTRMCPKRPLSSQATSNPAVPWGPGLPSRVLIQPRGPGARRQSLTQSRQQPAPRARSQHPT